MDEPKRPNYVDIYNPFPVKEGEPKRAPIPITADQDAALRKLLSVASSDSRFTEKALAGIINILNLDMVP